MANKIINPALLAALMVGFNSSFQEGLDVPDLKWNKIATEIKGTGASTTYGWLGKWPKFREWVGDRQFKTLQAHAYTLLNKKWESSIAVTRDEIEDDQIGVFSPMFKEMGQATAEFPEEMLFQLLADGFTNTCYDGQNFFDTDHPVNAEVDGSGVDSTVSNMTDGLATPWFLLDTSRALKPLIYQVRRPMEFKSQNDGEASWLRDEYQYGVDGRNNAGYAFWQMAHGSKVALTSDNVWAAHQKMRAIEGDGGKKLNVKPTALVVPPSLEKEATKLLMREKLANGEDNELFQKYELIIADFLV